MEGKEEILSVINSNHSKVMSELKGVTEDLRGNGGFNEGLIPAFKRHSKEDTDRELLVRNEITALRESIGTKKPKEGILGWFEKHEKTIQLIILVYLLIFHPLIINQILK